MYASLMNQVRVIAIVTTAVANGLRSQLDMQDRNPSGRRDDNVENDCELNGQPTEQ